ncbi:serine/threonine-protein kinase [Rubricoccus marinus]|uniref:Protein kinase domain-containing protein n=1 Tax=Rubricoccus marinus TaxID=716817 RepID=A0A259U2M1_9BACT|nr:serine/threonine-protein kinase [Rubricoccus marinus]OZC04221.1 hypothetical protein BSZ36_15260 [Rubricoccus marinus]
MADISERWTRIQTLFEAALERPADDRTAWLRSVCGDDPDLYREVESLLEGDAHQHTLFGGRAADLLGPHDLDAALSPTRAGEIVGPWRLIERIGSGGMGAVYRAERASGDYEQTAALKLIKPGMDSEAVVARFEAERKILARLQHPGIARLLDGGLTADRRPYFAMDLVEGEPITDYADARGLGIDARLRLFAAVCEAVRYAHQSLVVHRDLKPSNIVVTEASGAGSAPEARPVLLDFGIARLLADDEDTALTRTGHRVLTPSFAAPEQIRGESPTTATDVYALGGLLYRLICGAAPLAGETALETEQAVLSETPKRPSARVTPEASGARGLNEAGLMRRLRGDLDVICLKALAEEPERRYGSAAELLADVQRHLAGLPVEARPASGAYRVRKFVARHRVGVIGTAVSLAALVALTAFYTVSLTGERDRVEAEARRSEEVVAFLKDLLLGASPYEAPGEELTARELVDRGAARVDTALAGEPATQAAIQSLIAEVYMDINRAEDAIPLYRKALVSQEAEGLRAEAASTQRELGRALRETGATEEAERYLRSALATFERLPTSDPAETALTQRHLGSLLRDQGDFETAERLYRTALATAQRARGPDDPLTADITNSLVIVLRATDRNSEAADLMADLVASDRRVLPPNHPDLGASLAIHSTLLSQAGRSGEAVRVAREALRVFRAAHPDTTHPDIAGGIHGVAIALEADGQLVMADRTFADAIRRLRASRGDGDTRTLSAIRGYASLKETRGDLSAAIDLYLEGARAAGDTPRYAGALWSDLAAVYVQQGRWPEAREAFRRAADAYRAGDLPEDVAEVTAEWRAAALAVGRPGEGPPRSAER